MKKYTVDTYTKEHNLSRQSAINKLSQLKKKNLVSVSGGGTQKRIYTVHEKPFQETNGFYDLVNKYSPEKLVPRYRHYVYGKYTIEDAIIDGLKIGDQRTKEATMHLFRHVKDWTRLFNMSKKENLTDELIDIYKYARERTKVRKMPQRYLK